MADLVWTPDTARLDSFKLWEHNPKAMTKARAERLLVEWEEMGQWQTLAVGPDGECYDGHQRIQTLKAAGYPGEYEIAVRRASRPLTDAERRRVILASSFGTTGVADWDMLAAWPDDELKAWGGFDTSTLAEWNNDAANLQIFLVEALDEASGFAGLPTEDRAPFQQMTFTLHDTQVETVKEALGAAKSLGDFGDTGNENSNGNALARICEVFLGGIS